MKINDDITKSIADSVAAVLEGKKPVQEMDPKKHVKKDEDSGMFCVYNTAGKKVKEFESQAEAEKYATDNHDDLMSESPDEPVAKGEKDFKDKHKVKKSGENTDGTVTKEEVEVAHVEALEENIKKEGNAFTKALNAAREKGDDTFVVAGKKYQVEDYDDKEDEDEEEVKEAKSFPPMLVKKAVAAAKKMGGNMTGAIKDIEKMAKGLSKDKSVADALQMANESVDKVMEDNKAKYKAFFDKALKKYGVDSPAELKGDKKKEFFDYVDKNYNSEDEPGKDGVK